MATDILDQPVTYDGKWNFNQDFLKYIAYLITRTGAYAEIDSTDGWLKVLEEIYRDTSGICEKKFRDKETGDILQDTFKGRLNRMREMTDRLKVPHGDEAARLNAASSRAQILKDLDIWQIEYMALMHKHNLLLPQNDKRRGVKGIEDEYGINQEP